MSVAERAFRHGGRCVWCAVDDRLRACARCEKVFEAWTNPGLLERWFAPAPWTTPVVETDVRPGSSSLIVMRGPEGNEFPNRGVYP
jgi:uncharacterized protein YndB with AHSA1/START domain